MKKLIVLLTAILMGTICLPAQEVSASSNKINTQRISKKWKKSKVKIKFPILMYHSIASTLPFIGFEHTIKQAIRRNEVPYNC